MNCSLYEPETQESLFLPLTFKSALFSPNGQQPPPLTRGLSCSLGFLLHPCWKQLRDFWAAQMPQLPRGLSGQKNKVSYKMSDSQLWCHHIAHIATAALGIFIRFALLLLLLCFILRHPLTPHALGWAAAFAWNQFLHLCLSTRL